jgi:hypothetical protein
MNNGAMRARPIFAESAESAERVYSLGPREKNKFGDGWRCKLHSSRAQPAETFRNFRTFRTFDIRAPWGAPVARRPWRRQFVRSGRPVGARAWIEAALGELALFEPITGEV